MTPRTGRPKSENPKKNDTRIRMSDEEVEMLNYCCQVLGLTKADVIRKGIKKVYEEVKKQDK
jgi:predicted DNA-binding protein